MSEQSGERGRPQRNRSGLGAVVAYASGAITAAGALGFGVLFGQVVLARRTIPGAEAPPPRSSGLYGSEYSDAPLLRLALLGDSTAAGYGVTTRAETPGALLSTWIAEAARRPVRLTCPAVVGSPSAWLAAQVETVIEAGADLAIILIGANDVTTRERQAAAVSHLAEAVSTLRGSGAEVVVATCPDLGTIRPIQPPLRWLARLWSRQLAAAQTIAVVRAGGRTVSLADLLGPQFDAAPERMFGQDRYHPSAEGYVAAAKVVLPAALAALGLGHDQKEAGVRRPLAQAAVAAAKAPGREVVAASVDGTGPRTVRRSRLRRIISTAVPALRRRAERIAAGSEGAATARSRDEAVLSEARTAGGNPTHPPLERVPSVGTGAVAPSTRE